MVLASRPHFISLVLIVFFISSGCSTRSPQLYQWGSYEGLVYDMYTRPGKAEPGVQIIKLNEDIQRAQAEGRRVAPGIHAHLGFMYLMQGNVSSASTEFTIEREMYPEATVFIDGMLQRLNQNQTRGTN